MTGLSVLIEEYMISPYGGVVMTVILILILIILILVVLITIQSLNFHKILVNYIHINEEILVDQHQEFGDNLYYRLFNKFLINKIINSKLMTQEEIEVLKTDVYNQYTKLLESNVYDTDKKKSDYIDNL
jgi:hypothetical protein